LIREQSIYENPPPAFPGARHYVQRVYVLCMTMKTERDCFHNQCQENGICNEKAMYLLQDRSRLVTGLITLEKSEYERLKRNENSQVSYAAR
jgi:hypothetical protein